MSQCPKCFEPLYACCCNVPEIDAPETHKPPVQPRVMPDVVNIVKESLRSQYELLRACEEKDAEIERLRAALTRLVAWEGPVELACPELGGLLKAMYDARRALEGKYAS